VGGNCVVRRDVGHFGGSKLWMDGFLSASSYGCVPSQSRSFPPTTCQSSLLREPASAGFAGEGFFSEFRTYSSPQ